MKEYIYCNASMCVGCGACVVACMDENNVHLDKGERPRRQVYKLEDEEGLVTYFSGAYSDFNTDSLIGLNQLIMPLDSLAQLKGNCSPYLFEIGSNCNVDTNSCMEKVKNGKEPACVRVCPYKALMLKPH